MAIQFIKIQLRKATITENISKLEGSVVELDEALQSKNLKKEAIPQLEKLKEGIAKNIATLKEEFIELELSKK